MRNRPLLRDRPRGRTAFVVLLTAVAGVLFGASSPAAAHTGFESSSPADGEVVMNPVEVVTITFTGEANPVGDGFVALDASGELREPVEISTTDDRVFEVRFDPPLAGGQVGIRWTIQAADAHPIEGAFSFTVDAPAPAPTSGPPTTPVPGAATPAPATSAATNTTATTPVTSAVPGTAAAVGSVAPTTTEVAAAADDEQSGEGRAPTLEEFLTVDNSSPGETTATVGRVVGFIGVALGLGALAFAGTALRGRREEVRATLRGVRLLGAVIAVGALIEYVGVARIGRESLAAAWSTAPGFATVLRVVGGLGIAVGIAGRITRVGAPGRGAPVARSLSAAVATASIEAQRRADGGDPSVRWTPTARSWPALTGVALVIASFWFDGHTVSKGFRPLHALVNSVHVVAGAVWVGGVVSMAAIVWTRHRSGRPMRVVELVVRFSKIATIALASVVAAGILMAILVLDSAAELTGTPWGQILLLKSAAVGLAAVAGAYNHFRLLPALEIEPGSPDTLARLRSTLTAEAILLVFVVTVTAWLVAAAS